MFVVAGVTAAGWLLMFLILLAWPAPDEDGTDEDGTLVPSRDAETPPAVVSLLAGRLRRDGYGATLADLAARGWFRLAPPGLPAGAAGGVAGWPGAAGGPVSGPAGPVMCVVPAEAPVEPLTPYERRVVVHVALRAGAAGQVPAPALADGFQGGEATFMSDFRGDVAADATSRGLTRHRLSGRRIALLCLTLAVPAAALGLALGARQRDAAAVSSVAWFVLSLLTIRIGVRRRPSAAGRAVLERWHAAADAGRRGGGTSGVYGACDGGPRLGAYAAALGRAPGVVAVFGQPSENMAWSGYRGSWQQIPIEANTWTWRVVLAGMATVLGGCLLFLGVVTWLATHGLGALVVLAGQLTALLGVAGIVAWALRRRLFPRFAEFDGQVIRQWAVTGDDESPDQYHIAVDDGIRDRAWDLPVSSGFYGQLAPGTLVHARVSLWRPRQASVHLVEPAARARQLADPGAPHDPRGPALPDVRD